MGFHIKYDDARNEAKRLAHDFFASQLSDEYLWRWECGEPTPDVLSNNNKVRKTVVKWCVAIQMAPKQGEVIDGGPVVLVDILAKEARFL